MLTTLLASNLESALDALDPEVFFHLQLIMFFAGIRSERQLMEQADYNLAMRCGCPLGRTGYNLHEALRDHSSLHKIRARLGVSIFRPFFETVTEQGIKAGLDVPLPDRNQRTPSFATSLFTDDVEYDRYLCPAGKVLRRQKASYREEKVLYQADAGRCICNRLFQPVAPSRRHQQRLALTDPARCGVFS